MEIEMPPKFFLFLSTPFFILCIWAAWTTIRNWAYGAVGMKPSEHTIEFERRFAERFSEVFACSAFFAIPVFIVVASQIFGIFTG